MFSWILCIIPWSGHSNFSLLWTQHCKQDGFLKSLRLSKLYIKSWWSSWAIFFLSNHVSVCCAHYMHTLAHARAPKGLTFCMQCTLQFWGATDATSSWAQTKSWSEQRWYSRRAACHMVKPSSTDIKFSLSPSEFLSHALLSIVSLIYVEGNATLKVTPRLKGRKNRVQEKKKLRGGWTQTKKEWCLQATCVAHSMVWQTKTSSAFTKGNRQSLRWNGGIVSSEEQSSETCFLRFH